jgi:putative oxidoreductase
MNSRALNLVSWGCQIIAAVVLGQTLFFKFTAAPESVYIFTKVGLEPYGRIGSGIAELTAAVLLLMPRYRWAGALLAMGIMAGAILSHLTVLGVAVMGDHGLLFGLALLVFATSTMVLLINRRAIPVLGERLA